jgi:hypothetical protein
MMQTALDDQNVLAAIREWKLAAIADETLCGSSILRDESGGQIHTFDTRKTELLQRVKATAAAAKQFHDFRIAWPLSRTQFPKA